MPGCAPRPAPLHSAGAHSLARRRPAQSHVSYSSVGLGSDATDLLVALVEQMGPEHGLYGAKITGGGSGGTVCILGSADADPAVREVVRQYERRTGARCQRPPASRSGFTGLLLAPLVGRWRRFWARVGPVWGRAAVLSL